MDIINFILKFPERLLSFAMKVWDVINYTIEVGDYEVSLWEIFIGSSVIVLAAILAYSIIKN